MAAVNNLFADADTLSLSTSLELTSQWWCISSSSRGGRSSVICRCDAHSSGRNSTWSGVSSTESSRVTGAQAREERETQSSFKSKEMSSKWKRNCVDLMQLTGIDESIALAVDNTISFSTGLEVAKLIALTETRTWSSRSSTVIGGCDANSGTSCSGRSSVSGSESSSISIGGIYESWESRVKKSRILESTVQETRILESRILESTVQETRVLESGARESKRLESTER